MKKYFALSLLTVFLGFSKTAYADFSDVAKGSEYYQAISTLENLGVVEGYPDGTFRPDQLVSRAEFAKIIYLTEVQKDALPGEEIILMPYFESEPCFPDIKMEDWFLQYVCFAKMRDIVSGYPDGNFKPTLEVNLVEGAKMTARGFFDEDKAHWAIDYLEELSPYFLPYSITAPNQKLTRSQVAEIAWRYFIATEDDLKDEASKFLVWNGERFLVLDYIGSTQYWVDENWYGKNESGVYYINHYDGENDLPVLIEGADPDTFVTQDAQNETSSGHVLSFSVASDKNGLYVRDRKIEGSYGGSFELYNFSYGPKNYLYVFFGRDRENVYPISCWEGCHIVPNSIKIDPETFTEIGSGYYNDKDEVYSVYGSFKSDPLIFKLNDADPSHFQTYGGEYGWDLDHVFYRDQLLPGLSPKEFFHLPYPSLDESCPSIFYSYGDELHLLNKVIDNFNASSFEFLHDYGVYFKNDGHIYRLLANAGYNLCSPEEYMILDDVDPNDFQALGLNYFVTGGRAYYFDWNGTSIQMEVDLNSFESLLSNSVSPNDHDAVSPFKEFAKDKNYFYYKGKPINDVDYETFHFDESTEKWTDKNGSYSEYELGV